MRMNSVIARLGVLAPTFSPRLKWRCRAVNFSTVAELWRGGTLLPRAFLCTVKVIAGRTDLNL
jgi:hypothetical protein